MRGRAGWIVAAAVAALLFVVPVRAGDGPTDEATGPAGVEEAGGQQLILWTSGDREVALKMVFMYDFRFNYTNTCGEISPVIEHSTIGGGL